MEELSLKELAKQLKCPSGKWGKQVGEKMNKDNLLINLHTIEHLKMKDKDNILEIGMGNGFFVKDIFNVNNNIHYTGCDFSLCMVQEACRLNDHFINGGNVKFFLSNAEKLPFDNDFFDHVFSVHSIYFWENPLDVLMEIYSVLKPNGQLTISIRPKSIMELYRYSEYEFTLYDNHGLRNLIEKCNFNISQIVEREEYTKEINGVNITVGSLLVISVK